MSINIFLSTYSWTLPLNSFGVRQHVVALYDQVFMDQGHRIFPTRPINNLALNVLRHFLPALLGKLNVVSQGYPFILGGLISLLRPDPKLIVHTWQIPGSTEDRLSSKVNDILLRHIARRASAVVVVSLAQKRQFEAIGVSCPVLLAKVSVDSKFWHANPVEADDVLREFNLTKEGYILTAGGPDRDEIYASKVARLLGLTYVRASWDAATTARSRQQLADHGLDAHSLILTNPSDIELRSLYSAAFSVCLPTLTRTNPAGLTSLATAMACGGIVAVPESISEGYVVNGVNGYILTDSPEEFVAKLRAHSDERNAMRSAARTFAQTELNNFTVAQRLRNQFNDSGVIERGD
jgi:glycosyltransferase involved in cell wall biosynthesis